MEDQRRVNGRNVLDLSDVARTKLSLRAFNCCASRIFADKERMAELSRSRSIASLRFNQPRAPLKFQDSPGRTVALLVSSSDLLRDPSSVSISWGKGEGESVRCVLFVGHIRDIRVSLTLVSPFYPCYLTSSFLSPLISLIIHATRVLCLPEIHSYAVLTVIETAKAGELGSKSFLAAFKFDHRLCSL